MKQNNPQGETKPKSSLGRKLWKGFLYTANALIFPMEIRREKDKADAKKKNWTFVFKGGKVALFAAVYFVLQPLSLLMFPRIDEKLKQDGIDPKIVKTLTTATNIRVIPDNIFGEVYCLLAKSPGAHPFTFIETLRVLSDRNTRGFENNDEPGLLARLISPGVQQIFLKSNKQWMGEELSKFADVKNEEGAGQYSYRSSMTPEEFDQLVTFHEIAHTSTENRALPEGLLKEGDADYKALVAISKVHKDGRMAERLMLADIFQLGGLTDDPEHNTGLYVYERFTQKKLPAEADLLQAAQDAGPVIEDLRINFAAAVAGKETPLLDQKINDELLKLSPLALTRVELYKSAFQQEMQLKNKKQPAR